VSENLLGHPPAPDRDLGGAGDGGKAKPLADVIRSRNALT